MARDSVPLCRLFEGSRTRWRPLCHPAGQCRRWLGGRRACAKHRQHWLRCEGLDGHRIRVGKGSATDSQGFSLVSGKGRRFSSLLPILQGHHARSKAVCVPWTLRCSWRRRDGCNAQLGWAVLPRPLSHPWASLCRKRGTQQEQQTRLAPAFISWRGRKAGLGSHTAPRAEPGRGERSCPNPAQGLNAAGGTEPPRHQLRFRHFVLKTEPLQQPFVSPSPTPPPRDPAFGFAEGLRRGGASSGVAAIGAPPPLLQPLASGAVNFHSFYSRLSKIHPNSPFPMSALGFGSGRILFHFFHKHLGMDPATTALV